jgi:hypothetical protein
MQTEEYKKNIGISQSSIKEWKNSIPSIWKKEYIDKEDRELSFKKHFDEGSYIDSLLLEDDEFLKNHYFISDIKVPSESVQKIITKYYNYLTKYSEDSSFLMEINDNVDVLYEIAIDENYGNGNYSKDRVLKEVINKGEEYFNFLYVKGDKTLISSVFSFAAMEMVENIKKDKYVNELIYNNSHKLHLVLNGIIKTEYMNIPIKGELDILSVDTEKKEINIVDLKKCLNVCFFKSDIRKWQYAHQQSFYKELVIQNIDTLAYEFNMNLEELLTYSINNYNLVIDEKYKLPMIYKYYNGVYEDYKFGTEKYQGWNDDIKEIAYAIKFDKFDYKYSYEKDKHINVNANELFI